VLPNTLVHKLAALPPGAKLALMAGSDALLLPVCLVIALALRLGSFEAAVGVHPLVPITLGWLTLPVLGFAGLYRTVVRHLSILVMMRACAALGAVLVTAYAVAFVLGVQLLPRSALIIYWFIAFAYVMSSRFAARAVLRRSLRRAGRPRLRTAIYGAGEAGAQLAHTMQFSLEYQAVCFLDDRAELRSRTVAGLRVYPPSELANAIEHHAVDHIVVAIPSATAAQKRQLIQTIEPSGLPVKIIPGLMDLVNSQVSVSDIRDLDVADLLGRDAVMPQPELFARNIFGKVVLVTGAGGSIGSELCRQILSQRPRKLILFDHSEFGLYTVNQELAQHSAGVEIEARLGSVLDADLLSRLVRGHGVQTIYHAAAYKHVPLVESNMQQGLRNNVFGSRAVARVALSCKVETCVLISTDKAVRPTNVMGASKRAAELIFQAAAQHSDATTVFSMVRFGNVLGSSGSVVPLFKQQISAGGPLTLTHPDIIRYFMLIPEAAQLVIQAGAMARGGEVFVLDMGEPVRIADLARSMIHLAGLRERTVDEPDGDIRIDFVGLRPGEKLYEELLIGDDVVPSGHPRILSARERHIDPALLDKMLDSLQLSCNSNEPESMLRHIRNIVPEFRPADEVNYEVAVSLKARKAGSFGAG
jgi:FlaA1/EpsC-like NDP-sugar epimerase